MSSSPRTDAEPTTERSSRRGRFWPTSLTSRLVLTSIVLVASASLVVTSVATLALRHFLLQRLDGQLSSATRLSEMTLGDHDSDPLGGGSRFGGGPGFVPGQGTGTLSGILNSNQLAPRVITDQFQGGVLQYVLLDADAVATLSSLPTDGQPRTVALDGLGRYRVVVENVGAETLVSGLPTKDVDATIGSLIGWEALVSLLAVLLAAGAGLFVVRRQLKPLRQVAVTARHVSTLPLASGQVGLTARVPADVADPGTEVGQVGLALNLLLGRVEEALDVRHRSEQRVRQFVADASHELRTPLSTIQGYAELSRRGDPSDAGAMLHALNRVESESVRMAALVDDLLLLARLDSGRPLDSEEVDLTMIAVEAVNDARVVAPDHTWRLELPNRSLTMTGDAHRLHQVVSNLVGNARRHTGAGTTVTVGAQLTAADQLELTVHDDGPGLPPGLGTSVFERFSRGDTSRTRASGGAGLGLSIVEAIVEAHAGTVRVESRPGDTTFTVTLPTSHSQGTE